MPSVRLVEALTRNAVSRILPVMENSGTGHAAKKETTVTAEQTSRTIRNGQQFRIGKLGASTVAV